MYQALKRKVQVGVAMYQLLELYYWTYENRLEISWVRIYSSKTHKSQEEHNDRIEITF
jgi:hypothetical protein